MNAEDKAMKKHTLLMLIGCALPLLLVFLLPLFGVTDNSFLILLFLVVMLLCHLLMPMHYGRRGTHHGDKNAGANGGAKV
jgi:cell division protein FtsW (lipid II flippase)